MAPDAPTLIFWLCAAVAAWVQSITGFALGLILMSSVGLMRLMPLAEAAVITSILVIVNTALILSRSWRLLERWPLALILAGAVPALPLGFALLGWMQNSALGLLQLLLGVMLATVSAQMSLRPRIRTLPSAGRSFALAGGAGGILGGLFATTGPPVIWQLYRQPLPLQTIRLSLVAVFFVTQIERLLLAGFVQGIATDTLIRAAGALPAVMLGTWLARRFPPAVAPRTIRRVALILLFLTGISMIVAALSRFQG